ncbi:hypothetical protein IPL68_06935 [Candidatus Saccharibacteria bacterium]|nr:MAG: hypothetical protein IPL68_06935 [Candidatus Saccharibacteria bacterium]
MTAILVCLAVFQLAEFTICENMFGLSGITWARIGYVAITALPALGIHALATIAGRKARLLVWVSYAAMLAFMGYFAFVGHGITATTCGGNYVIFKTNAAATLWYAYYYYGLELITLFAAVYFAIKSGNRRTKQALYGLTLAYSTLLVPTATVNILNDELIHAVPSIMCGFAVFLALIVTLYVLPRSAEVK